MKKFNIEICRTSFAFKTFQVEAETEEEAIEKITKLAIESKDYSEKDSYHAISHIYCDNSGDNENGEK